MGRALGVEWLKLFVKRDLVPAFGCSEGGVETHCSGTDDGNFHTHYYGPGRG